MSQENLPLIGFDNEKDTLIATYFELGFKYQEILAFLATIHEWPMSLVQLKRNLKRLGLGRRSLYKDSFQSVTEAVQFELRGTGKDLGYRSMHDRITKIHKLVTDRETVRVILNYLDPEGVQCRRQRRLRRREYYTRGPNDLWHIDGWDKLKPYGFCVHGGIDGYSRRIIWLEVASTNNDPYVVCSYFANAILKINGLPNVVRADRGTENTNIAQMQTFLRGANNDNRGMLNTSFLYGRSTSNQRIESWWSKFGSMGMTTWIEHFKELTGQGIIDTSNNLDIECCRYCYMHVLKLELDKIKMLWNTHYIRASRHHGCPSGRPDVMYYMPDRSGGVECMHAVEQTEINVLTNALTAEPSVCNDNNKELFDILMAEGNRQAADNLNDAADNLVYLLDVLESNLSHDNY
ncbi:uncharacterized protein LOC106152794 [Lingula anatina]|uniref:Uncharacterized protein LOC106152794 n=1 Tax=Lingula anatina TaxID=7574 RepID=A0A1S3H7J4_LINAN|nr:uncharacterized protein LOC106152794 [Lingula anatina]|eukprot:XP_013381978.1 uncharacterized protein LOC106152794 [Lingula anatina]